MCQIKMKLGIVMKIDWKEKKTRVIAAIVAVIILPILFNQCTSLITGLVSAYKMSLPKTVQVANPEIRDIYPEFETTGRVEAKYSVDIIARVSGWLQKRFFEEGDFVVVCFVFKGLKEHLPKALFYPMFVYLLINGSMNSFALFQLISMPCKASVITFIGAVLFFISDSTLFYTRFKKDTIFKNHFVVMLTYIIAEFLIVQGFVMLA